MKIVSVIRFGSKFILPDAKKDSSAFEKGKQPGTNIIKGEVSPNNKMDWVSRKQF